jgi:hypothetical protein
MKLRSGLSLSSHQRHVSRPGGTCIADETEARTLTGVVHGSAGLAGGGMGQLRREHGERGGGEGEERVRREKQARCVVSFWAGAARRCLWVVLGGPCCV